MVSFILDLITEVEGGGVNAVYTNLDVTVAVNDHDAGVVEGLVVVIPRNPADTRGGQPEHVKAARAEGVMAGLQDAGTVRLKRTPPGSRRIDQQLRDERAEV